MCSLSLNVEIVTRLQVRVCRLELYIGVAVFGCCLSFVLLGHLWAVALSHLTYLCIKSSWRLYCDQPMCLKDVLTHSCVLNYYQP